MKHWLERNDIYFKTIASTLLSVMAIYVSWKSFEIANEATILNKLQGQPAFFVSYDFNREEDSKKIIYQNSKKKCKIDINATRNPVSNLYLRIIHFYLVEYEHSSSNQNSGTYKLIPIRGLFTTPDFKIGRANTSMAFISRGSGSLPNTTALRGRLQIAAGR